MSLRTRSIAVALVIVAEFASTGAYPAEMDDCQNAVSADETIASCTSAVEASRRLGKEPKNLVQAFVALAVAYDEKQQYDLAIQNWDEAIRRDPTDSLNIRGRAMTYIKAGDEERAKKDDELANKLEARDDAKKR